MARFSKSFNGMRLEVGDVVTVFGVKGKVDAVFFLPAFQMVEETNTRNVSADVMVAVDFGGDEPSVLSYKEIGAVYMPDNAIYLAMNGDRVALIDA